MYHNLYFQCKTAFYRTINSFRVWTKFIKWQLKTFPLKLHSATAWLAVLKISKLRLFHRNTCAPNTSLKKSSPKSEVSIDLEKKLFVVSMITIILNHKLLSYFLIFSKCIFQFYWQCYSKFINNFFKEALEKINLNSSIKKNISQITYENGYSLKLTITF